jgi:nucleoside-diphosphate-sugar epimerase
MAPRHGDVLMPDDLILVAGANGMLGSTIVRRLRQQGRPVRALSRDAKKLELSNRRFPEWRTAAARFSVEPITIEQFAKRYAADGR